MSRAKASKTQVAIFQSLQSQLQGEPWFAEEGWISSYHEFPSEDPEAITFHVSKKHWLNQARDGIHFETFLSLGETTTWMTNVTLHICHNKRLPGTDVLRSAVTKPFVDEILPLVQKWEGYRFRVGKYGMQPFSKKLVVREGDAVAQFRLEFTRLCRELGPVMDRVLAKAFSLSK